MVTSDHKTDHINEKNLPIVFWMKERRRIYVYYVKLFTYATMHDLCSTSAALNNTYYIMQYIIYYTHIESSYSSYTLII